MFERRAASRRREDIQRDRLFELSFDLLAVVTLDGQFRRLNSAWERTLGWTTEELKAKPLIEFVFSEDRDATSAAFEQVRGGGETVAFENRYRRRDGSYPWLHWSATPDLEHEVIYASARNITERKMSEGDAQRLAAIVESSDDAIFTMSLHGMIESWNPGAERVYGYRSAEILGKPAATLIPRRHVDHGPQILDQIRRGQRVTHYETVRRRKDGETIHVSLTVSPVRDAAGAVGGASVVARDITERRQAESDRLALVQRLEHALLRAKRIAGDLLYCPTCKRVRDGEGHWQEVEAYLADHSDASLRPGACPDHAH